MNRLRLHSRRRLPLCIAGLVVAVTVWSGSRAIGYKTSLGAFTWLASGRVRIGFVPGIRSTSEPALTIRRFSYRIRMWPSWHFVNRHCWYVDVPVWLIGVGSYGLIACCKRRGKAHPEAAVCLYCGYDLSGLNSQNSCPECGERTIVAPPLEP